MIVRDGGIEGVVIRLAGRGFSSTHIEDDAKVAADAGALDAAVARAAAKAGVAGLEFYAGIPGTIGGAITMNAGCYGAETKDVLQAAWGLDLAGAQRIWTLADLGYSYRRSAIPEDQVIWLGAVCQGRPDDPAVIQATMDEITQRREASQPIREKTGGSTFKNPPGNSAWKLIDAAGCRGLRVGGAEVSEMHCNFLINTGNATARDIEALGETVRARVRENSGIELHWEIKRIGIP